MILHINNKYEKGLTYDKGLGYAKYYLEEDAYIFRYRAANFINTDAFGTVCRMEDQNIYVNQNGNFYTKGTQITLYIWPFSNKMGVEFFEICDGEEQSEQIYIDGELNCVTEDLTKEQIEHIAELINDNEDEINELIKRADEKWDIGELL